MVLMGQLHRLFKTGHIGHQGCTRAELLLKGHYDGMIDAAIISEIVTVYY